MQYYIQNDVIKEVKHAKYLGVIIDHHLSWNEHINHITSKANNVKCFLQRNLSQCSIHIIIRAQYVLSWNTLVLCGLLKHKRIYQQLRQRGAARYVTNNYSSYANFSDTFTHLQLTSLNIIIKERVIENNHVIQQLVDIPKSNLIPVLDYIYYHTRSQEIKYIQPFARTDVYYYSFFPQQ